EHRRRDRSPRGLAEAALDPLERLPRPEVADGDDQHVVRDVVCPVEGADLLGRDPGDVFAPADDREAVGVRPESERGHLLTEEPARVVVGARPPLLEDHLALRAPRCASPPDTRPGRTRSGCGGPPAAAAAARCRASPRRQCPRPRPRPSRGGAERAGRRESSTSSSSVSSVLMRPGALLVLLLALATDASAEPCTESFAEVYGKVSPTVVSIQATKINKAKPQRRFETVVGSGVVVERYGQILTNAHVVDGATSLSVTL